MKRKTVAVLVLAAGLLWDASSFAQSVLSYRKPGMGPVDPAGLYGEHESATIRAVYETLVDLGERGEFRPGLAVSWTISPDFQTYTFKLRPGVTFHDGTSLSAEAVRFSFVRMLKIDKVPYGSFRKIGDENGIEILDPLTVRIRLKKTFPLFIADLVAPAYSIVSADVRKHATAEDPYATRWLSTNAAGSGPFRLVEWLQDQRIVLERFPGYWGGTGTSKGPAKVDRVVVRKVADPSTARIMLEKGEVDITEHLTDDQFTALKATPGVVVRGFDRPRVTYLTMDVRHKPFDSVKVRQAIAYSVNYEEIIQRILHGNAKRLHGLITEGLLGFDASVPTYPYDPGKARQLLQEAGYPSGFATSLWYAVDRASEFEQVAEYLQAYLGKVGIQLKLEKTTIQAQIRRMAAGNYGLALMVWNAALPDPDDTVGWIYDASRDAGGWTASFWMDPTVIEKMKQTRETADSKVRATLYRDVSAMAVEQAIFVPLYQPQWLLAWRAAVQDVTWDPFLGLHLSKLGKR
jgi:peptide/nickel transport system substrate-binding protein